MKISSIIRLLITYGEGKERQFSFKIACYCELHYRFPNADIFSLRQL